MKSFWYCKNCTEEINNENVTYQELHDRCGHPVEWIEIAEDKDFEEKV